MAATIRFESPKNLPDEPPKYFCDTKPYSCWEVSEPQLNQFDHSEELVYPVLQFRTPDNDVMQVDGTGRLTHVGISPDSETTNGLKYVGMLPLIRWRRTTKKKTAKPRKRN